MLSYDVEKFVAEGHTIVMMGRCAWRNKANGNVIDTPKVDPSTSLRTGIHTLVRSFRAKALLSGVEGSRNDTLGFAKALGVV
jgi:hypothetical protein